MGSSIVPDLSNPGSWDGKKATFYYTAEGRVDFRELIKRMAGEFKIRIEMKQIGARQEAGRLGGIGSCLFIGNLPTVRPLPHTV